MKETPENSVIQNLSKTNPLVAWLGGFTLPENTL